MSFATKQDWVAELIRERIIVGHYRRGEKLKQADLAAELGVSITPVREALLTLQAEGYVRGLPHKGLVVPEFVPGQAREIFNLRLMLERELTAIALSRLTPGKMEELLDLQRALVRAIESGDLQAVRTANVRFHFRLYEIAEQPQTLHFVRVLWAKYPFTLQDVKRERPGRMRAEHEAFLKKVQEDDRAGAVEAMAEHIRSGWREANAETMPAAGTSAGVARATGRGRKAGTAAPAPKAGRKPAGKAGRKAEAGPGAPPAGKPSAKASAKAPSKARTTSTAKAGGIAVKAAPITSAKPSAAKSLAASASAAPPAKASAGAPKPARARKPLPV